MAYLPLQMRARFPLMLTASLAAVVTASPALAQDNAKTPPATTTSSTSAGAPAQTQAANPDAASTDAGQDSNNEIVVTAQFRRQNLQDTPIAITAVTGAQLEQRGATTLSDATTTAPSVVLRGEALRSAMP